MPSAGTAAVPGSLPSAGLPVQSTSGFELPIHQTDSQGLPTQHDPHKVVDHGEMNGELDDMPDLTGDSPDTTPENSPNSSPETSPPHSPGKSIRRDNNVVKAALEITMAEEMFREGGMAKLPSGRISPVHMNGGKQVGKQVMRKSPENCVKFIDGQAA
eukprot:GABV01009066.1.p2 GENE.GABV01009066.1~~GABV01009066.1.p2  ORF type:complete len:176 (-),score=22.60 GABV01009066.1:290-763(-)